MKKTPNNLVALAMVFSAALVLSNVVAAKVVALRVGFLDRTWMFPGAVFFYAVTFLATDVVGEIWGKSEARNLVIWGFFVQIASSLVLYLTQRLPFANAEVQQAYKTLLGPNAALVAASLVAYLASQHWDVFVFHGIRNRILARDPNLRSRRWIWNNASTMSSQAIDTALFIFLGFGLGLGWFSDPEKRVALVPLALGQYLVKLLLAALDTPVFYLLTRQNLKKDA